MGLECLPRQITIDSKVQRCGLTKLLSIAGYLFLSKDLEDEQARHMRV